MKRLSTLSILIIMLATSCQTSSDLGSSSLIQKRRYTKGFNLNIKKPVISNEEIAEKTTSETALVEVKKKENSERLESPSFEIESDKGNERKLASNELSASLLTESAKNKKSEPEISLAPPTDAGEAYPFTIERRANEFKAQTIQPAAGEGAEVTLLIIILTILLPP
ncbi:MAG: hypothetical protein WBG42_01725, partial [Cryomorphaceae bacterium]